MKKWIIRSILLVLLVGVSTSVSAQYNRELVVNTMRNSLTLIGQIRAAANEKNYFMAATKLMELAQGFKALEAVSPRKGSKAEWDHIHADLINAAFRGIGACGEANSEKLQTQINLIQALNQEGHAKFR